MSDNRLDIIFGARVSESLAGIAEVIETVAESA
jgi:hypothetical protein